MGTTCLVGVDDNKVLKDFVKAHVDLLSGSKVCIGHWYPDYTHDGKTIRYYYSGSPVRKRIMKLLPQAVYARAIRRRDASSAMIHDSFRAFFMAHKVDVILAEFGPNGAHICSHARRLGIPLIVHFHGHDAHRTSVVDQYKSLYLAMFEYAFAVVSVSHFMTDTLVGLGADPARIVYNPYGPRDEFLQLSPDYRPTVLSVGRFTDIKANYLTLAAFRHALADVPHAKLVMVGEGELLEACRTLAHAWGIQSSVTFTGAVPHAQVLDAYERASCFAQHSVSPTYGDAEGTPVTVLEASAAGLPVIATRHAGIPDVVVHNSTGFLVDERDVESMGRHMSTLLADPELSRRMGAAARQRIRESFSMKRHIDTLDSLISGARSQSPGASVAI